MPGTLSQIKMFAAQTNRQSRLVNHFLTISPPYAPRGTAPGGAPSNEGPAMKGILLAVATIVLGTLAYITLGIALASVS